jgi:hypothetical protein
MKNDNAIDSFMMWYVYFNDVLTILDIYIIYNISVYLLVWSWQRGKQQRCHILVQKKNALVVTGHGNRNRDSGFG